MTIEMLDKLDSWLASKACINLETTGTEVCNLLYRSSNIKRKIAIAFSRYHHSNEPTEYIIADEGYVLTVPSFWLSIPKELVIPYLSVYIDSYIKDYASGKPVPSEPSKPPRPPKPTPGPCPKPPCPVPPPHPHPHPPAPPRPAENCEICDDPGISGYYINNTETSETSGGSFTNVKKADA